MPEPGGCKPRPTRLQRAPRVVRVDLPPLHEPAPMEELPPPEPLNSGHYKTRVSRVMKHSVLVDSALPTVLKLTLTDFQMQRDGHLDARDGLLYLLVQASNTNPLSAVLRVYWTLPDSALRLLKSTTAVSFNEVQKITAWQGPIPEGVALELELTSTINAHPVRVTADLCAKRGGDGFERGMWLDDTIEPRLRSFVMPPFNPDLEAARASSRKRQSTCGGLSSGPNLSGLAQTPSDVQTGPIEIDWCTPDPAEVDWTLYRERHDLSETAIMGGDLPGEQDPEVFYAVREPGFFAADGTLELNHCGDEDGKNQPTSIVFPRDLLPLVEEEHPTVSGPLDSWLGRCERFHEIWTNDVSKGLEDQRIQAWVGDNITRRLKGWNLEDHVVDAEGEPLPRYAIDESWRWRVPAVWFGDDTRRLGWYFTTVLNLVHAGRDLGAASIRTPRLRNDPAVLKRTQMLWRIDGSMSPRWVFSKMYRVSNLMQDVSEGNISHGAFDLSTLSWSAPPDGWVDEAPSNASFGMSTYSLLFIGRVYQFGQNIVPWLAGAAQTYQTARLLTMFAARFEDTLREKSIPGSDAASAYEWLVAAARMYYRYHLGVLSYHAAQVVHELYHLEPSPNIFRRIDSGSVSKLWLSVAMLGTGHCRTGCGQEKMSANWYLDAMRDPGFRMTYTRMKDPLRHPDVLTLGYDAEDVSSDVALVAKKISEGIGCTDDIHLSESGLDWSILSPGTRSASLLMPDADKTGDWAFSQADKFSEQLCQVSSLDIYFGDSSFAQSQSSACQRRIKRKLRRSCQRHNVNSTRLGWKINRHEWQFRHWCWDVSRSDGLASDRSNNSRAWCLTKDGLSRFVAFARAYRRQAILNNNYDAICPPEERAKVPKACV